MPSSDRDRITSWYARSGDAPRHLLEANQALSAAMSEWQTTPAEELRERTMVAARGLVQAVERHQAALPTGVMAIDEPLRGALADLHRGAGVLANLPADLDTASSQVREAGPILQSGYDGIDRATKAAREI